MNWILEGFMGSGKSAIGRRLAGHRGLPFLDTDSIIEEKQSMSIADIFSHQGEGAFRQMETAVLWGLTLDDTEAVISLGGGTPMYDRNIRPIKELGKVIYLKASSELLIKRLEGGVEERPMLKGGELDERVQSLLAKREDRYMEIADIIVPMEDEPIEDTCSRIIDMTKGLD